MSGLPENGGRTDEQVTPEAIADQLKRITSHPSFVQAPQLSRLLQHVVGHTLAGDLRELKEYALGVDVFNRGKSFDPRADNIVRAHARRLRQRLEAYYQCDGRSDRIVIELPKGHYVARFHLANRSLRHEERRRISDPRVTAVVRVGRFDRDHSDADLVSFADITVEDVLDHLARIKSIDVSLSADSHADYELSGAIRRVGNLVQISSHVTTMPGEALRWTHSFHQSPSHHFTKSALVAHMVEMVVHADRACARWADVDELALRELAKGHEEWWRWSLGAGGNASVAIEHWRTAARLEPRLWPAHAQLVILQSDRLESGVPLAESIARAQASARALLGLVRYDDVLPTPVKWQFPIAVMNARLDLDYALAEQNFLRAKERGWNVGQIEGELSGVYACAGDLSKAISRQTVAIAQGSELNQTWNHVMLARNQNLVGHFVSAQGNLEEALRMAVSGSPQRLQALLEMVNTQWYLGKRHAAQETLRRAWSEYHERGYHAFPAAFALLGMQEQAQRLIDQMDHRYRTAHPRVLYPTFAACALLGDVNSTLLWLDRVIDNRECLSFPSLRHAPSLDAWRSDTCFRQSIARLDAMEAQGSPLRPLIEAALRAS